MNGANTTPTNLIYSPCNSICVQNNDKLQLRSILKNGSVKSKQNLEIHML